MYWEINVSKRMSSGKYKHLFATHERSCLNYSDFQHVFLEIKTKFPEPEYRVEATKFEVVGEPLEMESLEAMVKTWIAVSEHRQSLLEYFFREKNIQLAT